MRRPRRRRAARALRRAAVGSSRRRCSTGPGSSPARRLRGPAIVEGPDTTVVVPPDRTATSTGGAMWCWPRDRRSAHQRHRVRLGATLRDRRHRRRAVRRRKGYASTTVREIADAAGILSGSLYHHFDSKESMIEALLRDFLERIDRAVPRRHRRRRPTRSTTLRALVHAAFGALATDRAAVVGDAQRVQRARAVPALRVPARRGRRRPSACGSACWSAGMRDGRLRARRRPPTPCTASCGTRSG